MKPLVISKAVQRQFIMGKQGLYPGRRWRGKEGVAQALRSGAVVQVDPLNVTARSHDITLFGRVLDYHPDQLDALLYKERIAFDYGGALMIYPMAHLPYVRISMARRREEPRWAAFAEDYAKTVDEVRSVIKANGPVATRDFNEETDPKWSYRSGKASGQALYYLWLIGELMTHGRRGFERLYDLSERVAPPELRHSVTAGEAEEFYATQIFDDLGIVTDRSWRAGFAGSILRKVELSEALARLDALLTAGTITSIRLDDEPKTARYILSGDVPLMESLLAGKIPNVWQPLNTSTNDEVTLLAPLEIVSARGRAKSLFDFEYLWEVYKPQEKRRWGYYVLPILYGDQLAARLDPKLDRKTGVLDIKGFWLEDATRTDDRLAQALGRGLRRFMTFIGATEVNLTVIQPVSFRKKVQSYLR